MIKSQTKKHFIIFFSIFIFNLISINSNIFSAEFQSMGNYAVSMGGAGVASSPGSFATYYNPAMLAHHETGIEFIIAVGLGIREINLADHIDKLSDINVDESLDRLEYHVNNPDPTKLDLQTMTYKDALDSQLQHDLISIKNELRELSYGNSLQLMPGISAGLQMGNIGIGLYNISDLTAHAIIQKDKLEYIVKKETNVNGNIRNDYIEYNELTNTMSLLTNNFVNKYTNNSIVTAIDNKETHVKLTGVSYIEVPFAYAKKIDTSFGSLSVGGSFKIMPGYSFEKIIDIDTESEDITDEFDDEKNQDTTFGFDLGFLFSPKSFNDRLLAGIVVKNINSPKFETKSGLELEIEPQIRTGFAYNMLNDYITLACDYDVTTNKTFLSDYESQYFGGGINIRPSHWLSFRAGIQKNLKDSSDGTVFTGGFAIGLKWFKIDLAAQYSSETGEYDGNEIPRYGKVQLSIVSNLLYGDKKAKQDIITPEEEVEVFEEPTQEKEELETSEEEVTEEPTQEKEEFETPEEEVSVQPAPEVEEIEEGEESEQVEQVESEISSEDEEQEEPAGIQKDESAEKISEEGKEETKETETEKMDEEDKPKPEEDLKDKDEIEKDEQKSIEIKGSESEEGTESEKPCPLNNSEIESNQKKIIFETLNTWAQSWANMDVEKYLSIYSNEFKPEKGISKKVWEKQRRKRLKKSFIKIKIDKISIKFVQCDQADVIFDQVYESPRYKDLTRKTIVFKQYDSVWKIIQEKGVTIKK